MQELFKQYKQNKFTSGSTHVKKKKSFNSYNIKNVENGMSEYGMSNNKNLFNNTLLQTSWKVYRCQLNTQEETCCCSCNSDAMFEVMKSLYDCYKKKNCDNCNCILCGHFPREERRLGELRKSSVGLASVTVETASDKERKKEQMKMTKGAAAMMIGKSPEEKEKILTDLAKNGVPLPKPKIASEKELIKKVTTKLELPPKPKTAAEKAKYKEAEAAGLIIPLEGKTTAQKENILRKQAELGIQLPQGRTASEKALIEKVKPAAGLPLDIEVPSEKIRKAKAAGYITPLKGKSPEQKEKILRGLAMNEIPLPEGKTTSEKLIAKVRNDLGLPPEPKTASQKAKYNKAVVAGIITPLKGKSSTQKEKILRQQAELGLPLPRGRNPSEKALIAKVKGTTSVVVPSEKLRKAKAAGFITPIEGKTLDQKEKILKGLATHGIPLPEGKTASEKKIIAKVRTELGLPPEPKTSSDKEKYNKAMASGLITPLEGKTAVQKEKILKEQAGFGLTLPEGRTVSEKALIAKVKATTRPVSAFVIPSEKLRKAKAAGLITPLQGKPPEVKEKILKGLVMHGIPLPEGKSPSEKRIIAKVRNALGLPPEPKTASQKEKYNKALAAGVISPLEGKTAAQKERVLREQANLGVPLPEGRTPSEKALIAKMKETAKPPSAVFIPSEKLRKAKAAGFLTPLEGKTLAQKQKILKGLAMEGIPLPEGKSAKKLIDKVRNELGLPPSPKSPSTKEKYDQAMATGFITPLEGKSAEQKEKVLKKQAKLGLPLPDGRTSSEKALIAKVKAKAGLPSAIAVPSEKLRKAKAAGVLTPLEGKTPEQKQKILKGMVKHGIPLPEGNTSSEKKIIRKIRAEVGLPPEPKNAAERAKYKHALAAGIITPLEGKSESQKEKILRGQADMGLPLPEGRTPSEKALIQNIKVATTAERKRTKSRGLVYGSPALSPDQARILDEKTAKVMKEGKGPSDDCICPLLTPESERLAKTSKIIKEATKITSKKLKAAKAAGFLTPLEGKSPAQKEKILRRLIKDRIPLPESKTQSDKKIIAKVRADVGLPPEPETLSLKVKYAKAQTSGLLTPLDGKSPTQKEKNLKGLAEIGVPLPEGRTSSEQALIRKVQASVGVPSGKVTSEKLRKAKAAGLITPLEGKTPEQKEHVLRGLAVHGIPLPEGNTPSEKKLIDKVRNDLGLPPEPTTSSAREKYQKAVAAGIVTPLEGKTPLQKEKILRAQADIGLSLPAGRTPSEKILIANIKATTKPLSVVVIPSEKLRKAKAAGILTPLEGKTPEQKEKILRGLAMQGIPLPKGKSISEKRLVGKVRYDLGLPPEPKTSSHKDKYNKAMAAGVVTPLEGKSATQKENILRGQAEVGLPLPEGRTSSEKALIAKVKATTKSVTGVALPSEKLRKAKAAGLITPLEGKTPEEKENILRGLADIGLPLPEGRTPSERALIEKVKATGKVPSIDIPSEKIRKAKAAGLTTPLDGKTTAQKEKILRGLAMNGISLPEGKTASEKIINKVRKDVGLPSAPKTLLTKETYNKAMAAGIITPLEGKSPAQKEKILTQQAEMGLPLPEGRTPSEKALIDNIKATTKAVPLAAVPLEKLRKAKAEGLITPLQGKTPEQREKILKGLASQGIPLPEGKTASEKRIIDKVRKEVGLPPEPKTLSQKEKYNRAIAAGVITPLKGKTTTQKEKIIRQQAEMGIPLPEGRTTSEKALIANIKATTEAVSATAVRPEKLRKAKAAGFITPLEGKAPEQIEKIIKGLAMHGIPLPKGKTASEKKIIDKVRQEVGLPPQPKTLSQKDKYNNAMAAGLITPLEGKSVAQKEKILKGQAELGLPLPEGRTLSEKALISKVKATVRALSGMSEKLRKAKAAGLLTPLEGKSPEEKEKILKGLVKAGIPLPEGKSQSEQAIIDKVRAEGPKLPSERIRQAKAAGLLTPLEGKTTEQKENILRGLVKAGVPLPEGKTPSEKELLQKIREEVGLPPEPKTPSMKEKYKRAQKAGIITPLEGRTKAQKEIILKRLHDAALPLPEGRTPSEKSIVRKVRAGLIEPSKVPSAKLKAAKAAGFLTPLEGKTPAQKEKKLIGLAKSGMPLPEGKTLSEKDLINKVRTEMGLPPEPKSPFKKKMEKAQAAGIITPLEGKSTAQKEKILKNMAKADVPLPEGRTPSEKALISQVQAEISGPPALPAKEAKKLDKITAKVMKEGKASEKIRTAKAAGFLTPLEGKTAKQKEKIIIGLAEAGLPLPEGKTASEKALIHKVKTEFGIPPEARTLSEKEIIQKAKAEGLITPLVGKTSEQKKKILRGLAEAGLPMPEGKTASEKEVVKKIRTEAGLPAEPTPSERGIIKTKSKKIGVAAVTKSAKEVGVVKLPAGIEEDFQDIIKTTTCDRGCGCDKKKIRFKHSYVKIRVTSPDISSLCPCPDECVPGVKNGVFTDNEGIKVTVGRAIGIPSYTTVTNNFEYERNIVENRYSLKSIFISEFANEFIQSKTNNIDSIFENIGLSSDSYDTNVVRSISVISFADSNLSADSSLYLLSKHTGDCRNNIIEESDYNINDTDYDTKCEYINSCLKYNTEAEVEVKYKKDTVKDLDKDHVILQLSEKEHDKKEPNRDSVLVINDLNNDEDVIHIVEEVILKKSLSNMSSIFLVVSSSEYESDTNDKESSMMCIQMSKNSSMWYNGIKRRKLVSSAQGLKISAKGKKYPLANVPPKVNDDDIMRHLRKYAPVDDRTRREQICQTVDVNKPIKQRAVHRVISLDSTQDKPCCCPPKEEKLYQNVNVGVEYASSVASELITPMIANQSIAQEEETDNNLCSKCCYLKIADGRTIRCQCSGAEKKLKLKLLCPCEVYEPPQSAEPTISIKTSKKEKEEKKRKRKWNKNVKCECPQDGEEVIPPIEPSEPFLPLIEDKDNIAGFEWKDTKEIIKLKSDLTQTTSGFKFDVKPRPALESLMSFEEALQYYAEHPSEADAILAEEQDVLNADKPVSIKKTGTVVGIKCACPYEPPPLGGLGASDSENIIDLKKGFKFHVDGKGSASPGLSGICCFDMVQQTTRSQLFPSHSSLFL
ncbi:LOW QUALITY PROTEIN: uncharacterized protein ACR2FA_009378 [Aphomia sociella]